MRRPKQTDFVRTALRVPPELHAKLHQAAEESERTFNAEILERLARSFDEDEAPRWTTGDVNALARELAKRMAQEKNRAPKVRSGKKRNA
jgi:hypothetical protein